MVTGCDLTNGGVEKVGEVSCGYLLHISKSRFTDMPNKGATALRIAMSSLPTNNRREKPGGNGDHVASVGAAPFGEHADEENAGVENTGIGVDKPEAR